MSISNYPLSWPQGWARTAPGARVRSNFNSRQDTGASYRTKRPLTVSDGLQRVLDALRKMGVPDWHVIISTNMPVRQDGLPYSGRKDPDDPGAAVYWHTRDMGPNDPYRCMAIDKYDRLADNLAAIAGSLEALRAVQRWGGAEILDRAFTGFQALPEQPSAGWWVTLEVSPDADRNRVEHSYKILRSRFHPDRPTGDQDKFHAVQQAWDQFCRAGAQR